MFLDIESTFEEYKEFCEEIDPNVEKTFEKSKEKLKILTPFEDALVCKYFSVSVIYCAFKNLRQLLYVYIVTRVKKQNFVPGKQYFAR